jgi:hypothetical protein
MCPAIFTVADQSIQPSPDHAAKSAGLARGMTRSKMLAMFVVSVKLPPSVG